ncbi:hypothetical protein ACFLFF_26980 [Brevibacillus reuszeri]|uniref:hypothetical protein n=1 Tax=Brevibacillus reuszeri TaxID=54915 RepID=UPI00366F57D2
MAGYLPPFALQDFSGGLNLKDEPYALANNQLADIENAVITGGSIAKRNGYVAEITHPKPNARFTDLYQFYFSDEFSLFLLASSDGNIYESYSVEPIPFSGITGLSSENVQMTGYKSSDLNPVCLLADYGELKVYEYVGNKIKKVLPHNPTTEEQQNIGLNDLRNLTEFRTMALKKDRFFAAAHPRVGNRLSFCHRDPVSGLATYDYWPATYFIDIPSDGDDTIVKLEVFRGDLVIFCKRTVWLLEGDGTSVTDFTLKKVNVPNGCLSARSVTVVNNSILYLSSDNNVYELFSTEEDYVSARAISQNVGKIIENTIYYDKYKAPGIFYDNKFFLSFRNGTTLVFDTLAGCWLKWTNIAALSFLERSDDLYFSAPNGKILKFQKGRYNDDGIPIRFLMRTRNFDFGFPVQRKKIKRMWTIAKQYEKESSSYNIRMFVDYVELSSRDVSTDISGVWDEGAWDDVQWDFVDVVKTPHRFKAKGEYIQVEISNNNLDEPFTLFQIVFYFKLKKPK